MLSKIMNNKFSINEFDKNEIEKLQPKISLIFRNYNKKNNNFEVKIIPKKIKKSGFFEKLFHIFN